MQNLIIQGVSVATPDLKSLAKLSGAYRIDAINSQAYRLIDVTLSPAIHEYCKNAALDYAFVPNTQTLQSVGLVVMDMDSTLIGIECIDEIADLLGLKPQVAAITASAMRGEIEFAESLIQRVALLENLDVASLQQVYDERLTLNPGADKLIATLKKNGIKTLLVSGGFTFFTDRLKARLELDFTASNVLEVRGTKLTGRVLGDIVDARAKADQLRQIRSQLALSKEAVIAIGDGANDLEMMQEAGVSIAYHAKPIVQKYATYSLNFVGLDGVLNLFA